MLLPRRLTDAVLVLATLVWIANFVLPLVIPSFHGDTAINGVYMAVVGGAFALSHAPALGGGQSPPPGQPVPPEPSPLPAPPPAVPPARPHRRDHPRPPGRSTRR